MKPKHVRFEFAMPLSTFKETDKKTRDKEVRKFYRSAVKRLAKWMIQNGCVVFGEGDYSFDSDHVHWRVYVYPLQKGRSLP